MTWKQNVKQVASTVLCTTVNLGEIALCIAIDRIFLTKIEREYWRIVKKKSHC